MIRNKPSQQLCDDDKLIAVLSDGDKAAEHQEVVEHIEQCPRCQQRFDELAAGAQDWTKARQALLNDDPCSENRVGSAKWDYSLRNEGPVAWTESMASQLLSPASHPELLGRLGRYDVERLIGSGGMGVVFKAHDSELNRPVAIKILAPYLSSSGPGRKRFAREARAAAAVVHEHVVPIYNVETERETPFLVMHYIAGESLQGRIDREGALELCEILRIGMQVAFGLSAAHQQGLVHRDIKPSNILMEHGVERALITDFGLARAADDASLTRTGFHPGTPQYMSPEQAAGEQVDARSDLFSLGSVLYTMCTGRPPFRAETSLGVLRRITDVEPRPIREINPNIPEWLCILISRLMAKSPADRFGNALEVADLLGQCLAHVQQPTSAPLPASLVPQATTGRSVFNVTRTGVMTMLAMSSILCLAAFVFMQDPEPPRPVKPQRANFPAGATDIPRPLFERTHDGGPWSKPNDGMRIRLRAEKGNIYEYGKSLNLIVDLQNNGDAKSVQFSDLLPTYQIQVMDESGEWSEFSLRAISLAPWESSREDLKPTFSYGWPIQFEHMRFVEPPVDDFIELRIGVARKPSGTEKDPHWIYSPPVIIELKDKPLTVGTNRLSETPTVVSDTWDTMSQEMDVVFRECNTGTDNDRAMHIDGAGKVTLINCGKTGRTTTQLSQERLDKLASELKACQFWKVTKEAEQPKLDVPHIQFQVSYGANNFFGQFDSTATWEGVERYKELQAILSSVMDEAVVHAKVDKVLPW